VGPRAGLKSAKNLTPTGIRSSDRPARSQSLYRLSYLAHSLKFLLIVNDEAVKFLICCIQLEKPAVQWADCWAVIFPSKCRTFVDIYNEAGREPKSVPRSFWYRGHLTKSQEICDLLPVKLSKTFDSLGRNCGNI
jgi:hypothetical protein